MDPSLFPIHRNKKINKVPDWEIVLFNRLVNLIDFLVVKSEGQISPRFDLELLKSVHSLRMANGIIHHYLIQHVSILQENLNRIGTASTR